MNEIAKGILQANFAEVVICFGLVLAVSILEVVVEAVRRNRKAKKKEQKHE